MSPDQDIALLRRIHSLLYVQGYTIKGVQRLLREGGGQLGDDIPPPTPEEKAGAARAEAERVVVASRGGMMTREELLHVVEHLGVVADTHASMQLAVSQLRTVCPELGRIISLLKVGRCNVNHAPPLFESKLWIMAIKCGCWVNTCWRYQVAIV